MKFTKFGGTGLTVSRMCIGTGTFGKQADEEESHRILDKAAEAGINFIDTADLYPAGADASGVGGSRASGIGLSSAPKQAAQWGPPRGTRAVRESI
jgi:aryl-alcohol dehydrogenase-like predicted oxidoreductase